MLKSLRNLILCAALTSVSYAHAAMSPVSLGLVPGIQFPPSDYSVTGARVSLLFGHHRDMFGLDLGVLGNITDQSFIGVAVSGLFNLTHGQTTAVGLQLAGIANVNTNKASIYGVQAALVNSNEAEAKVVGLGLAAINLDPFTTVVGAQVGIYNRAQDVYGFQIGLVNVAKNLHGIQIGLVNIHETGLFYVSPVINVGF